MSHCPCGESQSYEKCCGPYHQGEVYPPTAEKLMRARYSAFVQQEFEFIESTHDPQNKKDFDIEAVKEWSTQSEWEELEIKNTEGGQENDETGKVEFIARYYDHKQKYHEHHELADFQKRNGKWFFSDGKFIGPETIVREEPKIGRNEPCPCGSGKKYKKCCG